MVACSPAISHWFLTDLFLVTGYKALANTAFGLVAAHRITSHSLMNKRGKCSDPVGWFRFPTAPESGKNAGFFFEDSPRIEGCCERLGADG